MTHEFYMSRALALAQKALELGEVPVGCVIVWDDGSIVGEGYNRRETDGDALGHAEIMAIRQACQTLGGWRLHKGACGSVLNLFEESFGHRPRLYRGPLEAECAQLLTNFFAARRRGTQSSPCP